MKRYTVTFERDEEGWWVASVKGVAGVHTQGRSIEEARRHAREALAAAIGDAAAERAELVDDVRLPSAAKKALADFERAREREATASVEARNAAKRAVRLLTARYHLSRRDAAALTGFSFQRIHQIFQDL